MLNEGIQLVLVLTKLELQFVPEEAIRFVLLCLFICTGDQTEFMLVSKKITEYMPVYCTNRNSAYLCENDHLHSTTFWSRSHGSLTTR